MKQLYLLLFILSLTSQFIFSCKPITQKINENTSIDSNNNNDDDFDNNVEVSLNPLSFAVMLHVEGGLKIEDETSYDRINLQLKNTIDTFSKYNAKITIESEMPYIEAVNKWGGDDILNYAIKKGHGVGTHCDIQNNNGMTYEELVFEYKRRKEAVDNLVGAKNNLGCSGGWGELDWAKAAYEAGFSYLNAPVMMAYLSVPYLNRPINEETNAPYTNDEIKNIYYHDPVPLKLEERIYSRQLKNTFDLVDDFEGIYLISGSLGEISSLYEGRKNCFPNCNLTTEDTDYIMDQIDYVNTFKNDEKKPALYLHFPINTLNSNKQVVESWLSQMQGYQNNGNITWKTFYEIFVDHKER